MNRRADLRNIATIERLSKELLVQCGHYRRNSETGDDSIRFLILEAAALKMQTAARHGLRRYYRNREQANA